MKIFYHTDADGKCAAFWVKKLAKHYDLYERTFIPINYGQVFPLDIIQPKEQVYIVDYSIFPEEMKLLLKITTNVVWIDHHISAIKRYEDEKYKNMFIPGVRKDGVAGCMLTYLYLMNKDIAENITNKEDTVFYKKNNRTGNPTFTDYIADYDVWTFQYGEDTKKFAAGLNCYDLNPESDFWETLFSNKKVREVISIGGNILKYQDSWAERYCKNYSFETSFEGYKALAMNLAMISSEYFKSIENCYDLYIGFAYDGENWNYSLRSEKIDCSKIAMKYGGGGHKGAAGFSLKDLLIK